MGGTMMRNKKLYTFNELSEATQRKASYKLQEELSPTEDWTFRCKGIKEEVVTLVKEKTGQEVTEVTWETDSYDHVDLYSFNPIIEEKLAKKQMEESSLLILDAIEQLPYCDLCTDQVDDDEWEVTLTIDVPKEIQKSELKLWLDLIRKNKHLAPDDFEVEWKELRFQDRLHGSVDQYNEESIDYLITAIMETATRPLEQLELGYQAVYKELKEEAEAIIKNRIDYYNSSDYYYDLLKDGFYEDYRFLLDGTSIDIEVDPVPTRECEECFSEEKITEFAYTEEDGEVACVCKECAEDVAVTV